MGVVHSLAKGRAIVTKMVSKSTKWALSSLEFPCFINSMGQDLQAYQLAPSLLSLRLFSKFI
jgi:hypothetical protein